MGLIDNLKSFLTSTAKKFLKVKRGGIIIGKGDFPKYIIREAKKQGITIIGFGIKGITDPNIEKEVDELIWLELGELKTFIKTLKEKKVKYLTAAGLIPHRVVYEYDKFDALAIKLLNKAPSKRADDILKTFAKELYKRGVCLIDSTLFLKKYLVEPKCYTEEKPDEKIKKDIEFGFHIAKKVASLDIGQSIIVKEKGIIAVEAIEGTDKTILRAGEYVKDFTLIKVSKPNQDLRFDVPVIGKRTVQKMIEAGGKCIAISSKKALFLDREEAIELANKHKIIIIGIKDTL